MFVHSGPAGSRFRGIEDAGKHILNVNCDKYPCTTNSFILPPLFISKYPECRDITNSKPVPRVNPPLTQKEQKKIAGICSEQGGREAECNVFHLLTKLLEEEQDVPLLVLRDFELNTVGKGNLKLQTLKSEYPHIGFVEMRGEQDYIIFLKDLGFVVIEVKRALTAVTLQKAKEQLDRSESFLNDIMSIVAPTSYNLPILKLVLYELDDTNHPLTSSDYHFFNCNGDSASAFKGRWKDFIKELKSRLPINLLTPLEFKRLVRLLTGLWSMKSMNRQLCFDVNDASLSHLTTQVDFSVNHAHLSSDAMKVKNDPRRILKYGPVTDVVYNHQKTFFRNAKEINLMYLTPEQKSIYDNVHYGIIWGAAGTGKTLLILFKIIDLVQSHDKRKIILLAPHPHTQRCKKILEANGVRVIESDYILSETLYDVAIMGLDKLTKLSNFLHYHIFIDDFQSSFSVIPDVELMKTLYDIASQNNSYFWCMIDIHQHIYHYHDENEIKQLYSDFRDEIKQFYEAFFPTTRYNIGVPTVAYSLTNVLRNTIEISNVVLEELKRRKLCLNLPSVDAHSSHNITSTLPTYHQLIGCDDDNVVDLFVKLLEMELRLLVSTMNRLPLSDIAVLYEGFARYNIRFELFEKIKEMLSVNFSVDIMTIEQQLERNSSTIVFDHVRNATSGEWPVVIILKDYHLPCTSYVGLSRARTRLVLIGGVMTLSNIPCTHVAHVKWKREGGKLLRVREGL